MGKQWKQWETLFPWAPKSTADGDCSHEIKTCLLLGRKAMTNLDSILKNRDITLPTKVCQVKAMVFLVVMYGCESWTIKKAERWRIDALELWYWTRLLRVPWTARWSNQLILKETNLEYSLEALMIRLKLQYFGHLMWRADSLEKTLMLRKIEGRGDDRGWDGWMASPTQASSRSWWQIGMPGVLQSMGSQIQSNTTEQLNWTSTCFPLPEKVTDLIWGAVSTLKIFKAYQMITKCSKVWEPFT